MLTSAEWTCDQFLGDVAVPSPVFISPSHSVLMTGAMLAVKDINCGIIMEEGEFKRAIYGYQLVNFVLESPANELYPRLWDVVVKVKEIALGSPLPTIHLHDACKKALGEMVANRFGNLLFLDRESRPIGLLTLGTMLQAMEGKTRELGLKLREVASRLTLLSSEQTILEVFRFMMRNRVRRAVIRKGSRYYCCSEREILRALFSVQGLESMRDYETSFLNQPIAEIPQVIFESVPIAGGEMDVAGGWTLAVKKRSSALIVDGNKIATPWDLVVKPFLLGKLPF